MKNQFNSPVSLSPQTYPLGYANEKAPNVSSNDSHVDSKSTSDFNLNNHSRDVPATKGGPWGLSTVAFGFVIALITAIVVGGAVGGGIGAVVAMKNSDLTYGSGLVWA